jgi:hypothetical protein
VSEKTSNNRQRAIFYFMILSVALSGASFLLPSLSRQSPSTARLPIPAAFSFSESIAALSDQREVVASGSFEGSVVQHSQRVHVVNGWTPIHWTGHPLIGGGSSGYSQQPEYKPLTTSIDPYRVRTGEQSQCWFWFYNIGDAAIWRKQHVPAGLVQAEVYAHAWVSNEDGEPHSSPGEMYVSIGIDTEGRDPGYGWPWETSVAWSPYVLVRENWTQVLSRVAYMPEDGEITIYFRAWKKWSEKHGDVYWDDWAVYSINEPSAQPTYTPAPTYTPYPTQTPYPTYTPQPTPACTPGPISDFRCEYLFDEFSGTSLLRCADETNTLYKDAVTGEWACPK